MPKRSLAKRSVQSLDEARVLLGEQLRLVRLGVGRTTRQMDGYSSGHISNVESGKVMPSRKLVQLYASLGGSHSQLSALLMRAAAPRNPEPVVAASLKDPRADPRILRQGYIVEMVEDTHYFGSEQQPVRNMHRATVRFTSEHARYFPFRHNIDEDPRGGLSRVVPASACEIALVEESDDGVTYCVLAVEPGAADELGRCTFSWDIELDTNVVGRPRVEAGTQSLIPMGTKRVQFHEHALPDEVWWFRDFDTLSASMSETRRQSIPLNPSNLYTQEFVNVQEEWWGLAWTWRDPTQPTERGWS